MYTISQAAKKIGVSRQSVYNRLDRSELTGYVFDTEKGKMISSEGLDILMSLYPVRTDDNAVVRRQSADSQADSFTDSLLKQIDYIKSIVIEKDKQIQSKDEQISNLTRLLENSQILLKHEQEKNQLLLESSETKKKSFWSRFRKQ